MPTRVRCLYTKHVRQKKKTYHDGVVEVDEASRAAVLLDEGGERLAAGRAEAWPVPGDAEGVAWFEGFLFDVDAVQDDVRGGAGAGQAPASTLAAPPPARPPPRPAAASTRSYRSVPHLPAHAPPSPPRRPLASVAQPNALTARTDDDILALLTGRAPAAAGAVPVGSSAPPRPRPSLLPLVPHKRPLPREDDGRGAWPASGHCPPSAKADGDGGVVGRWVAPRPSAAPRAGSGGVPGPPRPAALAPPCTPTLALVFPTPVGASAPARRTVAVPDTFASAPEYVAVLAAALVEELNLRLAMVAARFHAARARAGLGAVGGSGRPGQQPALGVAAAATARAVRSAGVRFFADAALQLCASTHQSGDVEASRSSGAAFLTLHGCQEKSGTFRKDDLWVLGTAPDLAPQAPGAVGDRLAAPWVAVARSAWHGPNKEGRMEVELLTARPPGLRRVQPVVALHACDAATELAALAALRRVGAGAAGLPALGALLGGPPARMERVGGPAAALAAAASAAACLNPDQAAVLSDVAGWFDNGGASGPTPAACVVHGPFGSGKSSLLVALTALLAGKTGQRALPPPAPDPVYGDSEPADLTPPGSPSGPGPCEDDAEVTAGSDEATNAADSSLLPSPTPCGAVAPPAAPPPPPPGLGSRVLVVSHTNAAVDRVLTGLLDRGFDDILRVGPLRRVHRSLLPHSLHAPAARGADVKSELEAMLRAAVSPAEAAAVREELARVRAGVLRRRRALLGTASVVGTTCVSAAGLPSDVSFDVAVVDEASQITEPLAVMALVAGRCRCVVVAGDPAQLPPVVASPVAVAAPPGARPPAGLGRSLLSRLVATGHDSHLLRTQYRCHPAIAAVANSLFYGGRLLDGVHPAARAPLLPGLGPLALVDVPHGREEYDLSRSAFNRAEAAAVAGAVRALARAGVPACRVGVICFFRAQVACVAAALARAAAQDSAAAAGGGSPGPTAPRSPAPPPPALPVVATVDAFQGLERDVVLLTTAVTKPSAFAQDACRVNVALTRARHHLVLVGCARSLAGAPGLGALVHACRAAGGGAGALGGG